MTRHHHSLLGEGTDVGLLGAVTIAVFFLLLDTLQGRPFYTPNVLGQIMILGQVRPDPTQLDFGSILIYTVVHFSVFALFGIFVTELVHLAMRESIFLFALMMLFVVFELAFYAFTYVFFAATRELFPWWQILLANLLASAVMGGYLWWKHPALRRELRQHPLGT
jgi:hypothetical protein